MCTIRIDSLDFGKYLTTRIINVCKYNTEYRTIDGKFTRVDEPIVTVADLVKRTEGELMRTPDLERKSVDAIKRQPLRRPTRRRAVNAR